MEGWMDGWGNERRIRGKLKSSFSAKDLHR